MYITSSYLDKTISPLERVYRIWYATFSLRFWRYWMLCDDSYKLADNFVTLNSYLCLEINAHSLILLILRLQDRPQFFKPWLFSSQCCESYFRFLRSASSSSSTQVNFTMKEYHISLARKNDATLQATVQGKKDGIEYPREDDRPFNRRADGVATPVTKMPTIDEIELMVLKAQRDAEMDLNSLGNVLFKVG